MPFIHRKMLEKIDVTCARDTLQRQLQHFVGWTSPILQRKRDKEGLNLWLKRAKFLTHREDYVSLKETFCKSAEKLLDIIREALREWRLQVAKSVVYARTLPDELDEAVMKRYLNGEETHSIHKFEQYNVTAGMAFKRYAFCRASLMRAVSC